MNMFYKIQAEIIKNWDKVHTLLWGEVDDNIFITVNGFVGYLIPKKLFVIDQNALEKIREKSTECHRTIGDGKDYVPANFVGTVPSETAIKTIVVLENSKCKCYLDQKLFKQFQGKGFTYEVKDPLSPVRIYYQGKFYAIIVPVRYVGKK